MREIFSVLCEAKIREAKANGEFDNLPGKGRPLTLENLSFLPPELRAAFLILKNSGLLEVSEESHHQFPLEDEDANLPAGTVDKKSNESVNDKMLKYNVTMENKRRRF